MRAAHPVTEAHSPEPQPVVGLTGDVGLIASALSAVSVETWLEQPDGTWRCRETGERAQRVP